MAFDISGLSKIVRNFFIVFILGLLAYEFYKAFPTQIDKIGKWLYTGFAKVLDLIFKKKKKPVETKPVVEAVKPDECKK